MSELSDLYQEVILDHSRHPHNFRVMPAADRQAEGYNPLCGDQVTVYLKFDGNRITELSFQGQGCAISKSSASIMTDLLAGKTRDEASVLFERFRQLVTDPSTPKPEEADKLAVFAGVSEFPARVKCASLAWHTMRSALEGKKEKVKTE